eukprot:scaffold9781_cov135-Isochrysis_galbana.AAC.2
MAPRQPTLPPMEVDMNPEPGSERARPSRAEKISMQVRLRACGTSWPGWHCALAGTAGTSLGQWQWPELAALGKGRPPPLLPQLRLSTTILFGGSNRPWSLEQDSLHSNGPFQKIWNLFRLELEH